MKIKTTTSIDPYLKSSFESTQSLHNKSFSEVLEAGIQQVLKDVSPLEYVQLTISQREQELSELRSKLAELEVLDRQRKTSKKPESTYNPQVQEYLEEFRQEKFEKTKASNIRLWKMGQVNWKNVISSYQFTDKKEAQEWFAQRIAQEKYAVSV
ncbi:hypothetical protein [Methanolobus sp. ZRKC5]|uniref:hypothetical protein n=1 Tax=unclassified Methanolobus TaxID=2629569 RepID=UPI00313EF620